MARTIVVIGGGGPIPLFDLKRIDPDAPIIAVDSGLDVARSVGWVPELVVGDLDSVSADGLDWAHDHHVAIEKHRRAKDATDLELALLAALERGATRIEVLLAPGGRLDHQFANLLVLASPALASVPVVGMVGGATVTVVRSEVELWSEPGAQLSLFVVGADALGVNTTGLRYPLNDAVIPATTTLGVSNEFIDSMATVSVREGVVLAIEPG